ncbi:MAG TPA: murein L,D-transpeptidase catalytic domain family protein [Sphingomicrobium sp.]
MPGVLTPPATDFGIRNAPGALPAQPLATPAAPGGIDPQLFARAKAALDSHGIWARDSIGIVDFSKASSDPRFHVVDLRGGQVDSYRVAHGRGSDPDHSGWLERFSNDFGSYASSSGTYTTGDYYHGKYGLSLKTRGLDWSNNNAEARAIVIHNAWYAEPEMVAIHGKLGRSEGCFAFSRDDQWSVMRKLAGGRMIYADKLA